jgi:hypothetical protein
VVHATKLFWAFVVVFIDAPDVPIRTDVSKAIVWEAPGVTTSK